MRKCFRVSYSASLLVSIESTYNNIRVNGSFSKLLSVLNSIKKQKEISQKSIIIRINYTMMKNNIEELVNVYDFVKEYNVDILQLRHAKFTIPFAHLYGDSLFFHQKLL